MLAYHLRIAWKSLRRRPLLTAVLVVGVAVGVAVSTALITTYYMVSADPIPDKSDRLFAVQLDSWDPEDPWNDDDVDEPPTLLTYRDAVAIEESGIAELQSPMVRGRELVHPEGQRPRSEAIRFARRDFFALFDVPFAAGSAWGEAEDRDAAPVVVLSHEANQRYFGGESSLGETLVVGDRPYQVIGVLEPWFPRPTFYDLNPAFGPPDALYMPLSVMISLELNNDGMQSNWKSYDGDEYSDFLASETIWLQYWVQLDSQEQRQRYLAFLDAYTDEQRELGRFQRPNNNRLRDVMAWIELYDVVDDSATTLLAVGLLFVFICSLNLIGLFLGKYLSGAREVGVRRALGASRSDVFLQHLVEAELVGIVGGGLGLLLSAGLLRVLNSWGSADALHYQLDGVMVAACLLLALGSGAIAGVYPAWKMSGIDPAMNLKL